MSGEWTAIDVLIVILLLLSACSGAGNRYVFGSPHLGIEIHRHYNETRYGPGAP
jgi:hypothetical protein